MCWCCRANGIEKGNLLLTSGQRAAPPPHRRLPQNVNKSVCARALARTHTHLHVLHPSHLCMCWADKYCGSFSPWQSTVKNWGVIIALGGGGRETRMAKYAWLPPKLRRCVMKYGCCRQELPCDSFLVTSTLAFFFFSPFPPPFALLFWHFHLCSPIAFVAEWSPSKHSLPLNTYLSYNVVITGAKSSLIEYSFPTSKWQGP